MPPLKPQPIKGFPSPHLFVLHSHSHSHSHSHACFSTSLPRWPRQRPSAKPSHSSFTAKKDEIYSKPANKPDSPKPPQQTPNTIINKASTSTIKATPIINPDQNTQKSPSKRSAPPNTKPHKEALFANTLIRHSDNSPSLTTTTTKSQDDQISSAAAFFQQGFQFLYSAESLRHHPKNEHIPEILILGASNVGKSTFLNSLVGKLNAARVSARPGKTILMNAFAVGPLPQIAKGHVKQGEKLPRYSLVLVDTPGYGYKSQASWGDSVWKYIKARKMLRGAVVLLSSEKKLMEQDKWLLRTLAEANTRTLVVLTKADKGGGSWTERCYEASKLLRGELRKISQSVGNGWEEGSGWNPDIYITAAGMDRLPKLASGGGIGGVRISILEMAGFDLQDKEVKKKDETVTYGGPVVSFDDIKWKAT